MLDKNYELYFYMIIDMQQVLLWIADNICGALISACIGGLIGVSGTYYYLNVKYSLKKKQSIKSGANSRNIQVNGDYLGNDINIG